MANPPTLLLLVDSLLRGLPEPPSGEGSAPGVEVCAVGAERNTAASPPGCATALEGFLRKAYPLLDLWMRWLLITQRPGATGWGGQTKEAPLGAFQVTFCSEVSVFFASFCTSESFLNLPDLVFLTTEV